MLACTGTGRPEAEPEQIAAPLLVIEQPPNAPVRRRGDPSPLLPPVRPARSPLLPPVHLPVDVLAHTTDPARTHALADGWIAVNDRHLSMLVAPDGSIHHDPALALEDLEPGHRVDRIVGRWPDALYALVIASDTDDAWIEHRLPRVYRWQDGWTAVKGDGRRAKPVVYPPAWFYRGREERPPVYRPFAPTLRYRMLELSEWNDFRAENRNELWILGVGGTPFAANTWRLKQFATTPSGVTYMGGGHTLHRCIKGTCTLIKRGNQHTSIQLTTVGESVLVWGIEDECRTEEDPYGTCVLEIGGSNTEPFLLSNLFEIGEISASPVGTLWMMATVNAQRDATLWRRTTRGDLRAVRVHVDGQEVPAVEVHARDRPAPLIVARMNHGFVLTQPVSLHGRADEPDVEAPQAGQPAQTR